MKKIRGQILFEAFTELQIVLAKISCMHPFPDRGLDSIVNLTYFSTYSRGKWSNKLVTTIFPDTGKDEIDN